MISNDPYVKNRLTFPWVWWSDGFSEDELNKIILLGDANELVKGVTTDGNEDKVRKSKVKFFNADPTNQWIFDRFNNIITSINDKFYGFNLYGYDQFQYTVYKDDGRYDWHMDTVMGNELKGLEHRGTRKLSIVMLLNDSSEFTGGEFEINSSTESNPLTIEMARGRIVAFPSFMIHRVKPVLSGVRKSLVIWVEGPKFK